MYGLHLHQPLAQGTQYYGGLTYHAQNWRRTTRAVGGYWLGDFTITDDTMSRREMVDLYNSAIGCRIVERCLGDITWEGEIVQLDLNRNGVTYRTTLDIERWHNRVKVSYTDNATSTPTATAWSEETDSSDLWGESNYIDVVGDNYDSTSADAVRDRRLLRNAFPQSVPISGLSTGQAQTGGDSLSAIVAGYVFSMNRRFRESDTAAANASAQVTTLIGESEFVTAGRIETNTLQVPISGSEIAFRLWDGIQEIIEMGDGTNDWIGGVYTGQVFNYEQAATTVTHYWRDGHLLNGAMQPIPAPMVLPNIVVQVNGALWELPSGASDVRTSIQNVYIEEVEFIAPNSINLVLEEMQ